MNPTTTIPVTIAPEAAAHVAQLGMQGEFAQMLDYLRQNLSGLRRIEVELAPPYDTGDEDQVVIDASCEGTAHDRCSDDWEKWCAWTFQAFSPDVYRHFTLLTHYESSHAG